MDCNEIREKISCMLDQELSPEDSAAVAEHLAKCPECMSVFEAFHAVSESIAQLEEVPDGFTEAVMEKLPKTSAAGKPRRRRTGYFLSMAACLALVIFAAGHLDRIGLSSGEGAASQGVYEQNASPEDAVIELYSLTEQEAPEESGDEDIAEISDFPDMMLLPPDEDEADAAEVEAQPAQQETKAPPTPLPEFRRDSLAMSASPMSLRELLVQHESAAMNLYDMAPDVSLSVEDASGIFHDLSLWFRDGRVYCQDLTTGSAYYPSLTPDQVQSLMAQKP